MERFENKVVLITGGATGIGLATAHVSDDASYMLGQSITVDGGFTAIQQDFLIQRAGASGLPYLD